MVSLHAAEPSCSHPSKLSMGARLRPSPRFHARGWIPARKISTIHARLEESRNPVRESTTATVPAMSDHGDNQQGQDLTTRFVRKAKDGDVESISWVVERFSPYLHVSARHRIPNGMRAYLPPEDLVQEVWVVTLDRFGDLEEKGGRVTPVLLKFLTGVMLNKYRDHLRNFVRIHPVGTSTTLTTERASIERLPDDVSGVVTKSIRSEAEASLWESLVRLSEEDRRVVILRGIEQLPYKEIAVIIGEPPDTLRHRFRRALAKLREQLPDSLFHEIGDE